jgi:hypothetical protein
MPKKIWRAFKQAIDGREQYAKQHQKENLDSTGNDGHVYFIEVLKQVMDILSRCVHVQGFTPRASTGTPEDTCPLSNLFSSLEVDDCQDVLDCEKEQDDHIEVEEALPPRTKPAKYQPEIDPKEEIFFQYRCFVEDAREIVLYLTDRCAEYMADQLTLEEITLLTEAAVELISIMEWELTRLLGEQPDICFVATPIEWDDWALANYSISYLHTLLPKEPQTIIPIKRINARLSLSTTQEREAWALRIIEADTKFMQLVMELEWEYVSR